MAYQWAPFFWHTMAMTPTAIAVPIAVTADAARAAGGSAGL